jgi:hypothetical protein
MKLTYLLLVNFKTGASCAGLRLTSFMPKNPYLMHWEFDYLQFSMNILSQRCLEDFQLNDLISLSLSLSLTVYVLLMVCRSKTSGLDIGVVLCSLIGV